MSKKRKHSVYLYFSKKLETGVKKKMGSQKLKNWGQKNWDPSIFINSINGICHA